MAPAQTRIPLLFVGSTVSLMGKPPAATNPLDPYKAAKHEGKWPVSVFLMAPLVVYVKICISQSPTTPHLYLFALEAMHT